MVKGHLFDWLRMAWTDDGVGGRSCDLALHHGIASERRHVLHCGAHMGIEVDVCFQLLCCSSQPQL